VSRSRAGLKGHCFPDRQDRRPPAWVHPRRNPQRHHLAPPTPAFELHDFDYVVTKISALRLRESVAGSPAVLSTSNEVGGGRRWPSPLPSRISFQKDDALRSNRHCRLGAVTAPMNPLEPSDLKRDAAQPLPRKSHLRGAAPRCGPPQRRRHPPAKAPLIPWFSPSSRPAESSRKPAAARTYLEQPRGQRNCWS